MKNTILKQSAALLLAMSLLCGTATAGYAAQEAVAATSAASADTDETKAHKTPPTNADGTQKTPPARKDGTQTDNTQSSDGSAAADAQTGEKGKKHSRGGCRRGDLSDHTQEEVNKRAGEGDLARFCAVCLVD